MTLSDNSWQKYLDKETREIHINRTEFINITIIYYKNIKTSLEKQMKTTGEI